MKKALNLMLFIILALFIMSGCTTNQNTSSSAQTTNDQEVTSQTEDNETIEYKAGEGISISSDGTISTTIKPSEYTAGKNITIKDNVISANDSFYVAGDNVTITSDNKINAKDTTYTAGDNITIDSNNKISAKDSDTKYTAGTNITIDANNKISATGSGMPTDVQINGTSLVNSGIANIKVDGTYNETSNPILLKNALSAYRTSANQDTIDNNKQAKLTVGDNITIDSNNKISAIDTKYTAGTNISIDANNIISATDTKYTAGTNITIDANNKISATDTNTTYTAGDNITIDTDNKISATDTKYTAGTNITIDANNVISAASSALPAAPTADGTYTLQVTVSSGTLAYSWQTKEDPILDKLYPVNSTYVQLPGMPEPSTFGGTWEVDTSYDGKALWVDSTQALGTSLDGSLPNITGSISPIGSAWADSSKGLAHSGAFGHSYYGHNISSSSGYGMNAYNISFDASTSNSIYSAVAGVNVVRPTSFTVKVWKRTA